MFNTNLNKLDEYVRDHSEPESELLKEIYRQTHLKILRPRMLSGHIQGRILAMVSKMISPLLIFEIGTFTGYSAICLSEGLSADGKLITCDVNDEIEHFTRSFLLQSPQAKQIDYRIGDYRKFLKNLQQSIDLVYIDADKRQYPEYYENIFPFVRQGGYIIADNVLWNGKVVEEEANGDDYTQGVMDFNNIVQQDKRVENVIFPFRDGLMVLRKK